MNRILFAVVFASFLAFACQSKAAVTVSIQEVGSDVVATANGSLNINGLIRQGGVGASGAVEPNEATIFFNGGVEIGESFLLNGVGPQSWGPGGVTTAFSSSGDFFGVNAGPTGGGFFLS